MITNEGHRILNRDYAHLLTPIPSGLVAERLGKTNAEIIVYPSQEPQKKEEIIIESIEDIVEHKPGIKKVREYFSAVLENIKENEAKSW